MSAIRRIALRGAVIAFVAWIVGGWGCSGVTQIDEDALKEFLTLKVHYGDPGSSPDPCNDALPKVDGVAESQEWSTAEPLFLQMTGDRGNGADQTFMLELRAVWSDESKVGGKDRIYFLVRYEDDDLNRDPDLLVYGSETVLGEVVSSPPPVYEGVCDDFLLSDEGWDRVNPQGREDQVIIIFDRLEDGESALDPRLMDWNGVLLGSIGTEVPTTLPVPGARDLDVWVWRNGRTNLHPVYQFPDWNTIDEITQLPDFIYSRFQNTSGFAEDFWISNSSALLNDAGITPYVKNFVTRDPVPDRIHQCPESTREPTEEELAAQNGGIPKDLALWWPSSSQFGVCDTLACSRVGVPRKWGTRLLQGDYDRVQGWGLRLPDESGRDVRAKGVYEAKPDKGFPVRSVEYMREMDTGRIDDLKFQPENGRYRMVIGVLDASGLSGTGSTVVILEFETPAKRAGIISRCD